MATLIPAGCIVARPALTASLTLMILTGCGPAETAPPVNVTPLQSGVAVITTDSPPGQTRIAVKLFDGSLRPSPGATRPPDYWLSAARPVELVAITNPQGQTVAARYVLPSWQIVLPIWVDTKRLSSAPELQLDGNLSAQAGAVIVTGLSVGGRVLPRLEAELSAIPSDSK